MSVLSGPGIGLGRGGGRTPEKEDEGESDQGRDALVIGPGIGVAADPESRGDAVDLMKDEGGAGHGNGGGVAQGRGVDLDHVSGGTGQEIVLGREVEGIDHGPERGETGRDPGKGEIDIEAGEGSPDHTSTYCTL